MSAEERPWSGRQPTRDALAFRPNARKYFQRRLRVMVTSALVLFVNEGTVFVSAVGYSIGHVLLSLPLT